jgi:hypothetical protein
MPPFRRVEGSQAGPEAVGILIPPGRRTVLIVRPRALDWDLLPVPPLPLNAARSPFWEVGHDQAEDLARRLGAALEEGARVEALAAADGYEVRAAVGAYVLVACPRQPGQPYRTLRFATAGEAQQAAERIAGFLCPTANAGQELYFNARHFAR